MATNNDDLAAANKDIWSNLSDLADVAATVYDEEQRARKGKAKIVYQEDDEDSKKKFATRRYPQHQNYENLNGASSSSSSRLRLRWSEPQYDDEPSKKMKLFDLVPRKIMSSLRYPQQQNYESLNEASSSSSRLRIRWSEPCSSPLLLPHNTSESEKTETKTPPNPNSQSSLSSCLTENTSRKSRAVSQRRSSGGLKTEKKARAMPWCLPPLVRGMNGEHPMLIFEKTLLGTDVNPYQSRFSMPFNRLIRNDFLTHVELRILKEDFDNGVGAILVDPRSVKWGVVLKRWGLKNDSGNGSWTFSLTCGWNEVVEANELKDGDNIGVWSFRCRGILCFALLPLPPAMGRSSSSFLL